MIFTILCHFPNTTAVNNYFVRVEGRWFRIDAMLRWPVPQAPLDSPPGHKTGPNPRLAGGIAPMSFYLPLYGLVLATPRPRKISRRAADGDAKSSASDYLSGQVKKGSSAAYFFCVLQGGRS